MKKLRVYFGVLLFALFLGIAGDNQIFAKEKEWDKAALAGGATMEQAVELPELKIVSGSVTGGQADRYYSFSVKDKVWYNIKFYSAKNLTFYLYNANGKLLFRRTGGFTERNWEPWTDDYGADFYGKLVHGKYYIRVSGASGAASGGKYQDVFGDYEIFTYKSILGMEFSIEKDHAVYTGKEMMMPKITVKNMEGEVVSPEDYDIKIYNEYTKDQVNTIREIGRYQIVVCLKNGFAYEEGPDSVGFPYNIMRFSVIPKNVKSFRISSKKKGCIQVSVKRAKDLAGCYVMVAKDPKFDKIVKTYKMKSDKMTIKRLKSNKKYYVRVQSYKKVEYYVKDLGVNSYYYVDSDWSRGKSIVCK